MNKITYTISFVIFVLAISLMGMRSMVFAQEAQNKAVQSTSASLDVKVAPGELLPVSIKLSNFGGGKRVDVTIVYLITSHKGVEIYKTTETVAVETTNNFVKTIQIPTSATPGIYTAKTSIVYQGQVTPATTEFTFTVEKKILGLFQNEFFLYGGMMLLLGIVAVFIVYRFAKRRSVSRFSPIDYANIPRDDRVFYELISDTVLGMRQKVGDRALEIASEVEGLEIDEETGRIIKLTRNPSKIIAEIVSGYEKTLGKKVSFSLREPS